MTTRTGLALGLVAWFAAGCTDRAVGVAATGRIVGRLQTTRGEGLAGTVRLSGVVEAAVPSDDRGAFVFEAVPAGLYLVAATAPDTLEGVATAPVAVDGVTDATVGLVLTGVGSVSGTVLLDTAEPPAGTRVVLGGATATTLSGLDGGFALGALPEGEHSLFAVREGYEPAPLGEVEIVRGQRATLATVTLTKTSILTTSLSGSAHVPGVTDQAGIEVTVAGSAASGLSAGDGSYTLTGVPIGLVSLAFRRGPYSGAIAPVLVSTSAPPIVLARVPYVLPVLDLTFGERLPVPLDGGAFVMKSIDRIVYRADGLVSLDRTTGTQQKLASAWLWNVHPDGARIIAYRFTAPPATNKELVIWDPVTGAIVPLANDVEVALLLPKRNEILITAPDLRVVPLDGGAARAVGDGVPILAFDLAPDETNLLLRVNQTNQQRWIDLVTGEVLWKRDDTGPYAHFAAGRGLLLREEKAVSFLPRGATAATVLGAAPTAHQLSSDGKFVSLQLGGESQLWDLTTLSKLATASASATPTFSADSKSWLLTRGASGSDIELTIYDLPSGVAHPPLQLGKLASALTCVDRVATYTTPSGVGFTLHRIDLDQAQETTLVEAGVRLVQRQGSRLHFSTTPPGAPPRTQVIDVKTGELFAHDYPGWALKIAPDGTKVIAHAGERLVHVDLLTGTELVLVESSGIQQSAPSVSFLDDDTTFIRRFESDTDIKHVPLLQIGEGVFLGNPGKAGL